MRRKIIAVLLSMTLALGVTGCGSRSVKVGSEDDSKVTGEKNNKKEKETEKKEDKKKENKEEDTEKENKEKETKDEQSEKEDVADVNHLTSRVNYYDSDGLLLYYETFTYFDDGLLCSSTMHSMNYYSDDLSYPDTEYSMMYQYDDEGELTSCMLDGLSGSGMYDADTGKVVMDYKYDDDGNSTEIFIYPYEETIEEERFGVDPSKTEILTGGARVIDTTQCKEWAEPYYDMISQVKDEDELTDITKCRLIYINDDDVPELWIDYGYGYAGAKICTVNGDEVDEVWFSHGYAYYVERENSVYISQGHMGNYADDIYEIQNGKYHRITGGTYAESGDWIEDEGPVMTYYWENEEVTEQEYEDHLEKAFDHTREFDSDEDVLSFDQCLNLMEYLKNR